MSLRQFSRRALYTSIIGASSTLSHLAFADTETSASAPVSASALHMETVRVVASREPGNMLLDAAQLERVQATNLEDIFANESSVAVGGGSANAQKIYVRGFEDVMLNVTVDGAQSPGELYHHQARVQLEPEFIKTIELDAGAGVATNGAGALTGALKATLKDAFDMLEGDQHWGALVKATGKFNGEDGEKYTLATYGQLADNIGVILGYTTEERDEYEDGDGDLADTTGYEHDRGFIKLNGDFGDHALSLTLEDVADEAITFERPNLSNFRGTYELSEQELNRQTIAFNYAYNPANDLVDSHVTVYSNDNDFRVQRLNSSIIYGEGDFDSLGFDLRNTSIIGSQHITYGIDYREDDLTSAQNATPPPFWGSTEQSGSVAGVYIQDNWAVSKGIDITAGLRYDDYDFEGDGGVSDGVSISDSGLSPNIGASWEVMDGLVLRTAYAKAFRGVTIREAFFSALYIHDGELESEEADNLEFGISYETGNFFARGTVYKQTIENFIDAEFVGPPVWGYWRNVGDAEVDGYELEAGVNFTDYSFSLGVWDAENELDGEPLTDSNLGLGTNIGRTWLAKFDYYSAPMNTNLGVDVRYVESEENRVAPDAPDKESYTLVNAYANWAVTDALKLAATINNVFDEFYYDHATYTYLGGTVNDYVGFPSKGREIITSISYSF